MPFACHVMAKPSGSVCNIDCEYCFYLEKEKLYPDAGKNWRMNDEILQRYVTSYIDAQETDEISFAWQGGEPTLMGVDFFRRAVELQKQHAGERPVTNAFQTNGILLDDEWGEFLAENDFLVGISIDGPQHLHDRFRVDKGGAPTFSKVMAGLEVLKKHKVEFNTLTVLQSHNARYPVEVYRFLKEIGSQFMQFIPIVERLAEEAKDDDLLLISPTFDGAASVTDWSVGSEQYGEFLCSVFDEWVRHDVGNIFVQMFDTALGSWMGRGADLCVFAETCGRALILEHNGDLYSCDHFVYPEYNLGNIADKGIREMVESPLQVKFGDDKRDTLTEYCKSCDYKFACNGGCPKHRFIETPDGEPGLHYLCKGYKRFFSHVDQSMRVMGSELSAGRPAANVMQWTHQRDHKIREAASNISRNDPCPCGSGKKFKQCCSRSLAHAR